MLMRVVLSEGTAVLQLSVSGMGTISTHPSADPAHTAAHRGAEGRGPCGGPCLAGAGRPANLLRSNQAKCEVLHVGRHSPITDTGWEENGWRAALRRRMWGCWGMKDWP